MNYNKIYSFNISDGPMIGVSLYTQGCPFHCKGCFNPDTWSFEGGRPFTDQTIQEIQEMLKPDYIQRLSILGGEPLTKEKYTQLYLLLRQSRDTKKDSNKFVVWMWTGRKFEDIVEESEANYILRGILKNIDYIVDGQFEIDKRDITLPFCGSSNQRIISVKESLASHQTVLAPYDYRKEE